MTLGIEGADPGLLQRLAQRLGLADTDQARGTVTWDEPVHGRIHARAIELDVRGLRPGIYQVRLTIETADGLIASARRPLQIVGIVVPPDAQGGPGA
jgi:hypothetical protein